MSVSSGRPTLAEGISDSLVMARRELRATWRKPALLVFAFVQPVMFMLLFRYVFGGAIQAGGLSYVDFLVPGILVQTAIFGALFTGMGLSEDLRRGFVDRLRSLPIARSAVLVGRTLSDLVRNVATLVVMLAAGVAVGFRPTEPAWRLLLAVLLLLMFAYTFSWLAGLIGISVRDPETAQSAGFLWVFPVTFVSSAFVPTETMPAAIRAFADVNPMSLCVDAVRALSLGGDALGPALGTVAWSVGLLVVLAPLAVLQYRRLE